jgi:hypothetical protein
MGWFDGFFNSTATPGGVIWPWQKDPRLLQTPLTRQAPVAVTGAQSGANIPSSPGITSTAPVGQPSSPTSPAPTLQPSSSQILGPASSGIGGLDRFNTYLQENQNQWLGMASGLLSGAPGMSGLGIGLQNAQYGSQLDLQRKKLLQAEAERKAKEEAVRKWLSGQPIDDASKALLASDTDLAQKVIAGQMAGKEPHYVSGGPDGGTYAVGGRPGIFDRAAVPAAAPPAAMPAAVPRAVRTAAPAPDIGEEGYVPTNEGGPYLGGGARTAQAPAPPPVAPLPAAAPAAAALPPGVTQVVPGRGPETFTTFEKPDGSTWVKSNRTGRETRAAPPTKTVVEETHPTLGLGQRVDGVFKPYPTKTPPPMASEMVARVAVGKTYLKQYPEIYEFVKSGAMTSPEGLWNRYWKAGDQQSIIRKMAGGRKAIVHMLTGAGLNETEVDEAAETYMPGKGDTTKTILDKQEQLALQVRQVITDAEAGRIHKDYEIPEYKSPKEEKKKELPRVNSPEEADKLESGTQFIMPNGKIGTVP